MAQHHKDNQSDLVNQIIQEFLDAKLQGQEPDIDMLLEKHPDLASKIKKRLESLDDIDSLFDHLVPSIVESPASKSNYSFVGQEFGSKEQKSLSVIDFDNIPLGTSFSCGETLTASGVDITVKPFLLLNGKSTKEGCAKIENDGKAGGSGREIAIHDVNLRFNFNRPLSGLSLQYGEYGGNINLKINDDLVNVDDFVDIGTNVGGASVYTIDSGKAGKSHGLMTIVGTINSFAIGGQNLWLDNIMPTAAVGTKAPQLSRYEVIRQIGQGGMGAVFLARQISLDREVAIKVVSDISNSQQKTLDRFKRESKILAKISHPNIVQIYEVGEQGPYSYFAMQFVDGASLDKIIASIRNANPEEKASTIFKQCLEDRACIYPEKKSEQSGAEIDKEYILTISKIITDVAHALEYAHQKGILHRDIKPSNILIDSTGKAKLVDFGLAKAEGHHSVTVTGELFGTPNYISPEQIRYPEKVDSRSDVYSLGATFYECLTLHPPFEGETINDTLTKVLSGAAVPPRKYCAMLPTDFNTVMLHALEKDQNDRYESAQEFADDIQHVLDFKPITAKRPNITLRAYKKIYRNRVKIAVGLLIVLLISASTFVAYKSHQEKREEQRRSEVQQLLEDADILLCQAAKNTGPWPTFGQDTVTARAIAMYDQVLEIQPDNWWAMIQMGIASLVNGEDIESALHNFEKAETINPDFQVIPHLKSKVWEQLNGAELQDIFLKNAEELNAREAYILGLLALQQANPPENEQESLVLFEICLEKEPDYYPAQVAKMFAKSVSAEEKNLNEYVAIANLRPDVAAGHLLVGSLLDHYFAEYEMAIERYQRAVELQPWNPICYLSLGLTYRIMGNTENAEQYLLKAYELDNSSFTSLHLASFYARTKKDYKKALEICNEGLSKKSHLLQRKLILGTKIFALEEMGNEEQLQQTRKEKLSCLKLILISTGGKQDQFLHSEYLRLLYNAEHVSEARQFYEETSIDKPDFRFKLGYALAQKYDLDNQDVKALEIYESLYKGIISEDLHPDNSYWQDEIVIVRELCQLRWSSGKGLPEAAKPLEVMIKRFPQDSSLWKYYGNFLGIAARDWEGQANAYRQALRYLEREDDRFQITHSLARSLLTAKKYEEAEKEYVALKDKLDRMRLCDSLESWKFTRIKGVVSKDIAKLIYTELSDVYVAQGDTTNALAVLDKGLTNLPEAFELHRKKALIYIKAGDNQKAIQAYYTYFEAIPTESTVWQRMDMTFVADSVIAMTGLLVEKNMLDEAWQFLIKQQESKKYIPGPISRLTAPTHETSLLLAKANICFAKNDYDEVISLLNEATEVQPEFYKVWDELENVYISKKLYEQAKITAQKAIELNPDQMFGYQWLAKACWYLEQYEDGITALKKYVERKPKDARGNRELGTAFNLRGRYEEAIPPLLTAKKAAPNDLSTNYNLANAYSALKKYKEASELLLIVNQIEPDNKRYMLDLAAACHLSKYYKQAIFMYEKYLVVEPNDIQTYLNLSDCYHMSYRIEEAMVTCKKIIEMESHNVAARIRLIGHYRLLRGYMEALRIANETIIMAPNNAELLTNLAMVHFDMDQFDKAIELCKKAVEIKPDYWQGYTFLASSYQKKGDNKEAIKTLEKFIDHDDTFFRAYQSLAIAYALSEQYQDAVKACRKSLELKPDEALYHHFLGLYLQPLGHHEEAIKAFAKSIEYGIEVDKNRDRQFAYSLSMLERYEEAIIYYKRSLENDEDNESSWYSLGSCYYALKNYEDAAKCYEKAIQLKPDRFETYGYLINAHEQLGDYNVALEYAVKLIQLSPDSILPVMCLNAWGYNLSNYPDVLENYLQENEGDLEDVVKGLLYYCLGETTSVKGNNDKAKKAYSKAHTIFKQLSRTKPDYYYSFWGLGSSSYGLSQYGEAIKAYKKAMTLHENPLSTYAKLAFLYSTCPRSQYRDKNNALKFATKACELTNNQNDICLSVLAAACAENGDFENAIKHQQVAIDLADNESKTEYNKRLSEYKLNRPWRK